MKEKFIRFMQGRYGDDNLGRFLSVLSIVFLLISMFSSHSIWFILAFALLAYNYYRMFSKNIPARYAENQKFLQATAGIRRKFAGFQSKMRQRKTHHIYRCPDCKQKIRIPKGRGKIEIKCPKCGCKFIKNS